MRRISFTEEESAAIGRDRFHHPNPRVQQRMEILWLKMHGEIHERIAELAGCSRRSVQRVLDCFVAGGLNAVRQFHEKGRVNELAPSCEVAGRRIPRTPTKNRRRGQGSHRETHGHSSSIHTSACLSETDARPSLAESGRDSGAAKEICRRTCRHSGGFP